MKTDPPPKSPSGHPTPSAGVSVAEMLRLAVEVYGDIVGEQLRIAEIHWKAGTTETRTAIEDVIRTLGEPALAAFLVKVGAITRGRS